MRQRRQRVTKYVADSPSSRSESLEERVVKIERGLQKPQQFRSDKPRQAHQRSNDNQSNVSKKSVSRDERNRACTTTVNNENSRKDELLEKIRKLELAKQSAEADAKKISAQNDALNKEVDRLRQIGIYHRTFKNYII